MKITLAAAACLAVFLGLTAPANSATTIVADPTCLGFNSSAQRLVQCIGGGFEAEGFAGSGVEFSRNLI